MTFLERFSLRDKVALVTGGAGLFGRQLVSALSEAGARTIVASRSIETSEDMAAQHRANGLDVIAMQYNQGDEASILALRERVMSDVGAIDILVNNAVIRPMQGGYQDDAAAFARSMDVNATGLFIITRAFGESMAEQGRGSIINIGSIQGMVGPDPQIYQGTDMHGWYPDYFFHKGGLISFTRFIASYYGARNVRCNCLSPGGFYSGQDETFVRQYCERTMLGRMANEEDLKGAIVFLASDASQYVTGVNLPVDAGYTAR
jgi:NAD(P)-dependent dehydrogenase (short-subunit alcohol dehydrogenase family)